MVSKRPQCLAALSVVAFGISCMTKVTTTDGAGPDGSQEKEATVSLEAYATARARGVNLAESIAKDRYARIVETHTERSERFDGSETPLLKELVAVTWDSWRFLRDEWQRVRASRPSEDRDLRTAIIAHSWAASQDERALGLLAEQAIEERRGYHRVEAMTRVYHGMLAEMTPADMAAYHERFSKWWKSYEPNWRATMAHKAEVHSSAVGGK